MYGMDKLSSAADMLKPQQCSRQVLRLLALLFVLFPQPHIHAQSNTKPTVEGEARVGECWPNCGDGPLVVQGAPLPPCWPSNFGGTGTLLYSGITEKGNWHGWWCPVNGKWHGVGVVTSNDWLVRHPREPRATLGQMAAAYWALNVFEPASAELKEVQSEMWATLNKYPPQDPLPKPLATQQAQRVEIWKVAPLASNSRATYYLVDGKLQPADPRAIVGEPCDCQARKFTNIEGTWCAAPGRVELVTLCSREP
jgi:hypothetical protein